MLYPSMIITKITKVRIYSDKFYTTFCGLNVPEDDIECESFIVIFFILYLSSKANITCRYFFCVCIF